jgi:hypothetical protein
MVPSRQFRVNINSWSGASARRSDQENRLMRQERTHQQVEVMSLHEYISLLGTPMILQTFANITNFLFISLFIVEILRPVKTT